MGWQAGLKRVARAEGSWHAETSRDEQRRPPRTCASSPAGGFHAIANSTCDRSPVSRWCSSGRYTLTRTPAPSRYAAQRSTLSKAAVGRLGEASIRSVGSSSGQAI